MRLLRRADGYYCQFCISVDIKVDVEQTLHNVGLDVGLKEFYTDSDGNTESNPQFYRKSQKRLKFYQSRVSRKKKGSANPKCAINKLGSVHLKISRQREEHAKRLGHCVVQSKDLVAYVDAERRAGGRFED
ncbi:MAG: transposase [Okeania sp. SIO2H7]|nr:transposase [Okeania sp. SIO2H7]